ncbi:uncharacterized protein LOC111716580 [Eurytemora carolleeae]|uniref:uncharacterized protein LOC111716580 n=1 Tax=Eurytemora carolleeae TaxID=1294199 RepID=UPI000C773E5C|nr:uncharacterized protein LOC111716580 [Eurytemora carolleeae]|eukprot:XP_023347834.1 uncharacterized protein LOC111716580 [Eurytemora affinis]
MKMKGGPLSNSNLARTILKLNPGVDRALECNLKLSSKITAKENRASDYNRKVFIQKFNRRQEFRNTSNNRLNSRLDAESRTSINSYRDELRQSEELKLKIGCNQGQSSEESESEEEDIDQRNDEILTQEWQDLNNLSRRSSLKSSILDYDPSRAGSPGPTPTENPLGSLIRKPSTEKPEVVVTRSVDQEKQEEETEAGESRVKEVRASTAALLSLLPAPTPTRFVGKMHMKMEEGRTQRKSSSGSRRSSIAPKTETIEEEDQIILSTESQQSPRTPGIPTAMRLVGKTKLGKIGALIKDRRGSISDSSASSRVSSPTGGASKPSSPRESMGGSSLSGGWMRSRKSSPSTTASTPSLAKTSVGKSGGLQTLKAKAGLFKKKKKEEEKKTDSSQKEVRQRLFFLVRGELTDEEILKGIGTEEAYKEMSTGLNEIVSTASAISKFIKIGEDNTQRKVSSPSLRYVGALKGRVSALAGSRSPRAPKSSVSEEKDYSDCWYKGLPTSTRFLGKLVSKRDKQGLVVGTPPLDSDREDKMNPVFLALEKVKLKPQGSQDSSAPDSRISVGLASNSSKVGQDERLMQNDIVKGLQAGLCRVEQSSILDWNQYKHVRGDRKLNPIFIPF